MRVAIKQCIGECGRTKALVYFDKRKRAKDGRDSMCKTCRRAKDKINVRARDGVVDPRFRRCITGLELLTAKLS